ncbi:phosphoribosyltransferase-like protein [Bradyrhizobium sp. USDA 3315]
MNEALALKLLRQIMGWNEETAVEEYRWVRLMASFKYDGYRDYLAGARFPETLAGWLMQFAAEDRAAAYNFVKTKLLYFSPQEILRLVDQFYPRFVEPKLREAAAAKFGIPPYLIMTNKSFRTEYLRERRRTLFIGLSDGARIDMLRRSNAAVLVNDQIVLATHIDEDKWIDLGSKLKDDKLFASETNPKFDRVWLIDDFTGSGTSFLRPSKKGGWTGKLYKFREALEKARGTLLEAFPLTEDFSLHIHHYISSAQARDAILERINSVEKEMRRDWFSSVKVEEGFLLPDAIRMTEENDPEMWKICEDYYDHGLYEQLKAHLDQSSQEHIRLGYGNSALPVVLEHNCPNNAITLLWADTEGSEQGHPMRPLFMRRHRHS